MPSATLTITLELEIDVSGTAVKAEPDVGIPADTIDDIWFEAVRDAKSHAEWPPTGPDLDTKAWLRCAIRDQCSDQITDALMDAR